MAFMVCYCLTVLTLLSEMIVPYGYSDEDASTFGFWINLIGILGGVISAHVIGKTGHYRYTTIVLVVLTVLGSIAFQISVQSLSVTSGYWFTFTSLAFMIFTNMGINSYCLEYAVQLAPDIGESLSGGTLI
jgi:hypothetical protein